MIRDTDRGWKRIKAELKRMNGAYTKVGIQADQAPHKDEETGKLAPMVEIAAAHEFGVPDRGIPERSFLRAAFDDHKPEIDRLIETGKNGIFSGKGDVKSVLDTVGQIAVRFSQNHIKARIDPANSPATIARKGSDVPLIDKAQMIQSIRRVVVVGGRVVIAADQAGGGAGA
jgi:hypothetical protein